MAFGRSGDRHARAGGHGFLLGDEGSAYWIGRAAARAALRWEDRLGGSEAIHRMVLAASGAGLESLVSDVTSHPAERSLLTALAPALTALAATDPEAERITRRAAEHLAALAQSVRDRLGPCRGGGSTSTARLAGPWPTGSPTPAIPSPRGWPSIGSGRPISAEAWSRHRPTLGRRGRFPRSPVSSTGSPPSSSRRVGVASRSIG